jgi:hypothetical protein
MKRIFLEELFNHYLQEHKGYVELREINQKQAPRQHFFRKIDEIINFKPQGNLYFGTCPRETMEGKEENVKFIVCLWVDLDFNKEDGLKQLSNFRFQPSAVVGSGNGLHAYWFLKEPELVNPHTKGILKGLSEALNGDSVFDLARVLRVPGTFNFKDPKNPKEVKILSLDSAVRYNQSDFEEFEIPINTSVKQDICFSEIVKDVDIDKLELNPETKLLILGNGGTYPSRSEADFRVVCDLIEAAIDNNTIKGVFSKYPIGDKFREEGERYLSLTIAKAREKTKPRVPIIEYPITLGELSRLNLPPVQYILKPVLPEKGKFLISAPPGSLKTFWLLNSAIAISSGLSPFLGGLEIKKTRVLYVAGEGGESELKRRLDKMSIREDIDKGNLFVAYEPCLDLYNGRQVQEGVKRLCYLIEKSSAELLIIDPIGQFWSGNEKEKNEVKGLTSIFDDLMSKYPLAVALSQHWKKTSRETSSGWQMASGSHWWNAWIDGHITLNGTAEKVVMSVVKIRSNEGGLIHNDLILRLREEDLWVECIGTAKERVSQERLDEFFNSFGKDAVKIIECAKESKKWGLPSRNTLEGIFRKSPRYVVSPKGSRPIYVSKQGLD